MSIFDRVNEAAQLMNDAARRMRVEAGRFREVLEATSRIAQEVSVEKILIDAALECAQQKIDLERELAQDSRLREVYNEISARVSAGIAEVREVGSEPPPIEKLPAPRFDQVPKGSDSLANDQIEGKIAEMKVRRDQFIAEVKGIVGADAELCRVFKDSLFEGGGGHYWPAVDPMSPPT